MASKNRKTRHLRGSRTMGYGQIGQHRHSGKQGGHGQAGLHKHKWSWLIKNDPDHFGRDPFRPPGYHHTEHWINVGDLDAMAKGGAKAPTKLDLTEMGVQKLLGAGKVTLPFEVKVEAFTKRAQSKVEQAGGKLVAE